MTVNQNKRQWETVGIKGHLLAIFEPPQTKGVVETTTSVQKLLHSTPRCMFII